MFYIHRRDGAWRSHLDASSTRKVAHVVHGAHFGLSLFPEAHFVGLDLCGATACSTHGWSVWQSYTCTDTSLQMQPSLLWTRSSSQVNLNMIICYYMDGGSKLRFPAHRACAWCCPWSRTLMSPYSRPPSCWVSAPVKCHTSLFISVCLKHSTGTWVHHWFLFSSSAANKAPFTPWITTIRIILDK